MMGQLLILLLAAPPTLQPWHPWTDKQRDSYVAECVKEFSTSAVVPKGKRRPLCTCAAREVSKVWAYEDATKPRPLARFEMETLRLIVDQCAEEVEQ